MSTYCASTRTASVRAEHTRAVRLAAAATGESEHGLERRLRAAAIAVSVDPSVPGALDIAAMLVETQRRGPGVVVLNPTGLTAANIQSIAGPAAAVSADPVSIGAPPAHAVRVHVGRRSEPGVICALADGHGVRLTTTGGALAQHRTPSGLGVMFTAAVGGAEVFKTVAQVKPSRGPRQLTLTFCPVTLTNDPTTASTLDDDTLLELGLIGNGAIGTAHARILRAMPEFRGSRALLLDPEIYGHENVGTYSLGGLADANSKTAKVDIAAAAMSNWTVQTFRGPVGEALSLVDAGELRWPRIVLNGLDSIAARHDAQRLWPDRLIDAATGDTAVGLHDVVTGGPCLRCLLPAPAARESAAAALANELGLPVELVAQGQIRLDERHLRGLTASQRARLLPFVGKPICGLADAARLTRDADETYRPSVPFVSQQAACLAIGRLIAIISGIDGLANFVQYDTLVGPQSMTRLHRGPSLDCYCQKRAETITIVRAARERAASV